MRARRQGSDQGGPAAGQNGLAAGGQAKQGVTINEIHNVYKLPESLKQRWAAWLSRL